jgi:spermidine synthase
LCGDGDGWFLARLLWENSRVEVDFVDLSPRMIALAERRVAKMGPDFRERVRFHSGDVRDFVARPDGYDLIVTHFLDCSRNRNLLPSWRGSEDGGRRMRCRHLGLPGRKWANR